MLLYAHVPSGALLVIEGTIGRYYAYLFTYMKRPDY